MAVFEEFQKVTPLRCGDDSEASIIDDQHIHLGDGLENAFVAAIGNRPV